MPTNDPSAAPPQCLGAGGFKQEFQLVVIKHNFPGYQQTSVSLNIFFITSVQELEQFQLHSVWCFLLLKPTVGFLHQLNLPRLRLGVRSTTKPSLLWHVPTPLGSSEPGCPPHRHLPGKSGPWLSIPPGQGTSCHRSGATLQRGHRGKVASAYLHANHRIDEEQHGYEEGDIGQCLEEGSSWLSACLSPLPHTVTAPVQNEDPTQGNMLLFSGLC